MPTRLAGEVIDPAAGRYRQCYLLRGAPGATLVQQVRAEVMFCERGQPRVVYRCTYGEYFELDDDGTHPDRHDFDVRRNGWTRNAVARLLARHGAPPLGRGPFSVEVHKSFALAPGIAHAAGARGNRRFGVLQEGPFCPSHAELEVIGVGAARYQAPLPGGSVGCGSGRFFGMRGFTSTETLRHQHITRTGSFDDCGGYRPASFATGGACWAL